MPSSGYENIAPDELKCRLDRGERPVLLDVREPWEFGLTDCPEGHAPRARRNSPSSRSTLSCTSLGGSPSARSRSRRSASWGPRANSASSSV